MVVVIQNLDNETLREFHELCEGVYLDGECYTFAIALHRNLGWPIVGLMHKGTVRHALVRRPEDQVLFDARGPVTQAELGEPFGIPLPYDLKPIEENDLRRIKPIQEQGIARTLELAEKLWPDLPWKNSAQKRALRFAEELEQLSRKHGIWLRSRVGADSLPLLYVGYGDETGYTLTTFSMIDTVCTIDRTL